MLDTGRFWIKSAGWRKAAAVVLVVLLSAFLFVRLYLNPLVAEQISNMVYRQSGGLYRLYIGQLRLNLLANSASARFLHLQSDTGRLAYLEKTLPLMRFEINSIAISGINWWAWWKQNRLLFDRLDIQSPRLSMRLVSDTSQPDREGRVLALLSSKIAPFARELRISQLLLRDAQFELQRQQPEGQSLQRVKRLSLQLQGLHINQQARLSSWYQELFELDVQHYVFQTPNQLYQLGMVRLHFSSTNQLLRIDSLSLQPRLSDAAFNRRVPYQTDRFVLHLARLHARRFDLHRLLHQHSCVAGLVQIEHLHLDVRRDKRLPQQPERHKKMPNEIVRGLPFYFLLDTVKIRQASVQYTEVVPEGKGEGRVFFDKVFISAYQLSNDSQALGRPVRLEAQGRLMGQGLLSLHLEFPLMSKAFNCSYSGSLGPMDATLFNQILTPNEHLHIREGQIEKIDYRVRVTGGRASGSVAVDARKIKISLLDKKTQREKKLISALGNLIIDRRHQTAGTVVSAPVDYGRRPGDGFLRFLWRSLQSGLSKSLAGVPLATGYED